MSDATEKIPVVEIKPGNAWINLDLGELWAYRELIYFLTQREVKVRYKQTAIGIFWAILQPVLTTAIFTAIFSQFARFDSINVPYPLFALSGLLIWLYINTAVSNSSASLISNTALVTKVYLPRVIIPLSVVLSGLIDLLIGLALLGALIGYYVFFQAVVIVPSVQIFLAPVFILMAFLLALGCGILFSALNVRFRDVKHALPFALQVWMFLSPVFYPPEILTENWRFALSFNPLYGILQGFRASVLGGDLDWRAIGISAAMTLALLIFSLFVFKKMEDDFADVI